MLSIQSTKMPGQNTIRLLLPIVRYHADIVQALVITGIWVKWFRDIATWPFLSRYVAI